MTYPGGKGRCYQHIITLMPKHRVFIETHLGGGAVIKRKKPAEINIGIDIDPLVIKRWSAPSPNLVIVQADASAFLKGYSDLAVGANA